MPHLLRKSITAAVAILAPGAIALALAMDIYIPAVPKLVHIFNTTEFAMELTLVLFMVFSGLAQLVIGPISDQYGRVRTLVTCILLFTAGSVLCALSNHIGELIAFRILQAIGSCGMLVVVNAIVRDVFSGVESAKAYSYINGAIAFSPLFAPAIGSVIDIHLGWRFVFLFAALFGVLNLILTFFIQETLPRRRRKPFTLSVFYRYGQVLCNKQFLAYALSATFGLSYLFTFFAISSFILIHLLHVPEIDFGIFFGFMGASFLIGSVISAQVVGHFGVYKTVMVGNAIALFGGVLMVAWYWIGGLSVAGFVVPMLPLGIGGTISMGSGASGAMEPFGEFPGAASAALGSMEFLLSALIGGIAVSHTITSPLPLGIGGVIFSLGLLIAFPLLKLPRS